MAPWGPPMHSASEALLPRTSGRMGRTARMMRLRKLQRQIGGMHGNRRCSVLGWSVAYFSALFALVEALHEALRWAGARADPLDGDLWILGLALTMACVYATLQLPMILRTSVYGIYLLAMVLLIGSSCERTFACLSHRVVVQTPLGSIYASIRVMAYAAAGALETIVILGVVLARPVEFMAVLYRCCGLAGLVWCASGRCYCPLWQVVRTHETIGEANLRRDLEGGSGISLMSTTSTQFAAEKTIDYHQRHRLTFRHHLRPWARSVLWLVRKLRGVHHSPISPRHPFDPACDKTPSARVWRGSADVLWQHTAVKAARLLPGHGASLASPANAPDTPNRASSTQSSREVDKDATSVSAQERRNRRSLPGWLTPPPVYTYSGELHSETGRPHGCGEWREFSAYGEVRLLRGLEIRLQPSKCRLTAHSHSLLAAILAISLTTAPWWHESDLPLHSCIAPDWES